MLIVVFNLGVVRPLWGFVKVRDPGWVHLFCGMVLTLGGIRLLYGLAWVRPWLGPSILWIGVDHWWGPSTLWISVDPWWGPSTLWTCISLNLFGSVHFVDLYEFDPGWVRPLCGLVLTLGGVRPLCGLVWVWPGWVRPLCGSNLLVVMTQHSLNVPP